MIKMTMFLKRNPALDHEAFVRHHVDLYGPLFQSIPEVHEHVFRYVQTHPQGAQTSAVVPADYDGTAEIWFDNLAGLEAVFESAVYREQVFPDEKIFLDHAKTLTLLGEEVVIIAGPE